MRDWLDAHLQHLVRERDPFFHTQGHFYVREYVRQTLQQWGTVAVHSFSVHGRSHQNLLLNLPAATDSPAGPPILVGAHYDAVPGTPGADDNASGVAALLALARAIAAAPLRYPVRLVAFDLEEAGLLGSTAYAQQLKRQQQPLRLMLSLEMLGYCDASPNSQRYPANLGLFYPHRGDYIGFIGNRSILGELRCLSRSMRASGTPAQWLPAPNRGNWIPEVRLSDHAPFWDAGYSAVMVTDTAFLRNPHYHQPSDRRETLDLDFLAGACRGLEAGLRQL